MRDITVNFLVSLLLNNSSIAHQEYCPILTSCCILLKCIHTVITNAFIVLNILFSVCLVGQTVDDNLNNCNPGNHAMSCICDYYKKYNY